MRKLLLGIQAGMLGGTFVGLIEATFLLTSAGSVSDYVALVYATVLYGCIGAGQGIALGIGLIVLSKLWKGLTDPFAWALAHCAAFCSLGLVITMFLANKVVYAEAGVPMSGKLIIAGGFGLDFLIGLWLFPILLRKTPLKILMEPRGHAAAYALILVLAGVFAMAPGATASEAPTRSGYDQAHLGDAPNVLLIVVDTLRADYIGPYGGVASTPVLDDLAEDAIVFDRAHSNASWTRASFASIYTSLVPPSHTASLKSSKLPGDVLTVAEAMQGHGYATAGFPNNTNVTATFGFAQGFDHYPYLAPNLPFGATESVYQLSMYSVLRKVGERFKGETKNVDDFYQPATVAIDRVQGFVNAQGGDRWFTVMHLMEPHDPYFERPFNGVAYARAEHEHPDPDKVDYLKETYRIEIEHMDADLGHLIDWLKTEGLYDDTLIVVTADHGEEFLEHGGWWHGTTLFQEQIHIPLIVKLPDSVHAGTRVPWVVRHIDLAPTLVEAARGDIPDSWQGQPLFGADFEAFVAPLPEPQVDEDGVEIPVVDDRPDPRTNDRIVFAEQDFEGNQVHAVRQGDWKLIKANEGNPRGLDPCAVYDLAFDAGEQTNDGCSSNQGAKLDEEARDQFSIALTGAVAAEESEMDAATKARLQALGYLEEGE